MGKANHVNNICNAIDEIRKHIATGTVKAPLLKERLAQEEFRLLNELYEAVRKKTTNPNRTRTTGNPVKTIHQNPSEGGKNETTA